VPSAEAILEAKIDTASAELAKFQPARVANSDAKALQRYLLAVGVDMTPERLNDLLVLLSVLMIEVGGSLALANRHSVRRRAPRAYSGAGVHPA
jgi:hypothetical protein